MPTKTANHDFSDDEIKLLFARVGASEGGTALAVSGGADSTALLLLFARYYELVSPTGPALVVTVDHGLRSESAHEAAGVASLSARLGFEHVTLRWDDPKPGSALAEAAREARYALIADLMRQRHLETLLTAHTQEDQAETVLMRLARGSGVDGLSGMAPVSSFGSPPLRLARPLLAVSKQRLVGFLRAFGEPWVEDPTNRDPAYERPRLRAQASALAAIGLDAETIARSARRLGRARVVLDRLAHSFLASEAVRIDSLGCIGIARNALLQLDEEIALRVVRQAIAWAGGSSAPVPLGRLEDLYARLQGQQAGGQTLARASVSFGADELLFEREPGRMPPETIPLATDATVTWDNRFLVKAGTVGPGLTLGGLGITGLREAERAGVGRPSRVSAATLRALPAVWRDGALVAVPSLDFSAGQLQLPVRVEFKGVIAAGSPLSR